MNQRKYPNFQQLSPSNISINRAFNDKVKGKVISILITQLNIKVDLDMRVSLHILTRLILYYKITFLTENKKDCEHSQSKTLQKI